MRLAYNIAEVLSKQPIVIKFLTFIILTALLGLFYVWQQGSAPDTVLVDLVEVESGDVASVLSLTGELVNDRSVTITALLDGEITTVAAREGDPVKRGQTLAEQDPVSAQALLHKAEAELIIASANAEETQRKFSRAHGLWKQGDLSEQLFDDARLAAIKADAQVTIARSSVTIAARNVRDAVIRAPFDGQVIAHSTETGQWVEAGTPLFTLVATTGQVVEAYVDASDIAKVEVGQAAALSSDAWPSQVWENQVEWIAPVIADPGRSRSSDVPPNAIAIRIDIDAEAPPLRLGQRVDVELEVELRQQVPRLPLTALRQSSTGGFEAMIIENGKVVGVPVQTGLVTVDMAEITGGLGVGDQVIGSPVGELQAGMLARPR